MGGVDDHRADPRPGEGCAMASKAAGAQEVGDGPGVRTGDRMWASGPGWAPTSARGEEDFELVNFASGPNATRQALNHQFVERETDRLVAAASMGDLTISPASEVPFRVSFSGHGGHLHLDPTSHPSSPIPDFVLPPAYPPESPSSVKEYLGANYLNPELHLPTAASGASVGRGLVRPGQAASGALRPAHHAGALMGAAFPAPTATIVVVVSHKCGILIPESVQMEMSEVIDSGTGGIVPWMPGPAKDFVRGSMNSRPFRPGGLLVGAAGEAALEKAFPEAAQNGDWVCELMSAGPAQIAPPGFRKGLDLGQLKEYNSHWKCFRDGGLVEEQPASSSRWINTWCSLMMCSR